MADDRQVYCIPPEYIPAIWPYARGMLRECFEKTDYGAIEHLEDDLFNSRALLWLVWKDPEITTALVTQVRINQRSRACQIVACSSKEKRDWQGLREVIEAYARAENCTKIRALGRKGWKRMLPDARVTLHVYEKELT